MITSDEPGVYIEDMASGWKTNCSAWSRRTPLKTITLCPFDREAILPDRLTDEELEYLNNYHKRQVQETLTPLVSKEIAEWLAEQTAPITK